MIDLADRTVVVIGAGRAGRAAVNLLLDRGSRVRLLEKEPSNAAGAWPSDRVQITSDGDGAALHGASLVVPSPGVARSHPVLVAAQASAVPIWSEIELAARFLACPLVAVTGTNGKSTTTVLIGNILRQAGGRVFVGGNLGVPLAEAAIDPLPYDYAVVEVSSFQLEWIEQFRPRVAVWLNLTPDHQDRYESVDTYEAAKAALFGQLRPGDTAVLNRDDARVWRHRTEIRGEVFSFGLSEVDEGVSFDRGAAVIRRRGRESRIALAGRPLRGAHNCENMMAAIAVASVLDISHTAVESALDATTGLPHRLEFVAEKAGAKFYDDSKATNVGAVEKSIASFDDPIVLLLGGYDKGGDFGSLRDIIASRVERVVCFGAAGPSIAAQLGGIASSDVVSGVAEAVRLAASRARPGQAVVLAPGCASFDEFQDYADRGRRFRALVEAL